MYATERHDAIAAALQSAGRVSVADLAEHFDVTTETVRRDLDALESAGRLRRVHGGAVPVGRSSVVELTVAEREVQHNSAKSAIARAAMRLVPPTFTGSIALDAGTTCAAVAAELVRWEPATAGATLTVITNSSRSPRPCSTASTSSSTCSADASAGSRAPRSAPPRSSRSARCVRTSPSSGRTGCRRASA